MKKFALLTLSLLLVLSLSACCGFRHHREGHYHKCPCGMEKPCGVEKPCPMDKQ